MYTFSKPPPLQSPQDLWMTPLENLFDEQPVLKEQKYGVGEHP